MVFTFAGILSNEKMKIIKIFVQNVCQDIRTMRGDEEEVTMCPPFTLFRDPIHKMLLRGREQITFRFLKEYLRMVA